MGLIAIDETKCKKDGICTMECPAKIIQLQEGDGFPDVVPGGEGICFECGHCVAVCPHGALTHERIPQEEVMPVRRELTATKEQAVQFLRSRRSIRVFAEKRVEIEKIKELIEIARHAPTAGNAQPVEWMVFSNKDEIKRLASHTVDWMRRLIESNPDDPMLAYMPLIVAAWDAGIDAVLRNSPALVVASAPKAANNGLVDLTIALSYLELTAPTIGLGACWAGLFQGALLSWPALQEAVGLPEDHVHHYPMMLGYPKFAYHRMPARRAPRITWR